MKQLLTKHRETLLVALLGFVIVVALNIMMLQYHYAPWTNPKVGFWSAFWNRFEVSGFDPYTYIVVSKWRPLYVLSRHPLLAGMMWPLSQLNGWLMEETDVNCAIFIVGVMLVACSLAAWMLMWAQLCLCRRVYNDCPLGFRHSDSRGISHQGNSLYAKTQYGYCLCRSIPHTIYVGT